MSKTSKIILSILAIVLLVWVISPSKSNKSNTFVIGATESLTGAAAYYGDSTKKGIDLAFAEAKIKYPSASFEIYHEDNQFNPKVGVDAYQKLRAEHNIQAIITHTSPASVATAPLSIKDGILQMGVSAASEKYSTPNDLTFRTTIGSDAETAVMSDYIKANCGVSVKIFGMNNEIGVSEVNSMKKHLESKKVSLEFDEMFPVETIDFRSMIIKMKQKTSSNCLFMPALSAHISTFLKQAKELNYTPKLLSFRTIDDPTLIMAAGPLAEGVIYTSAFDPDSTNTETKNFVESYKKTYGSEPDTYGAEGYAGANLVIDAFVKCGKDYDCMYKYLSTLKDTPSVFGNISLDSSGDASYQYFLKIVKDGKAEVLK
jgi:branched-chain amino acid transport system substrate-binding protein